MDQSNDNRQEFGEESIYHLNNLLVQLVFATSDTKPMNNSTPILRKLNSQFIGMRKGLGFCRPTSRIGPSSCNARTTCWFKFGKNGVDAKGAGIYGSQSRIGFISPCILQEP
ncbi:hypothetical protein LXL04_024901 [Taraxacum kok-saghyz]